MNRIEIGSAVPHGKEWKKILRRWQKLMELYRAESDDLAYWYTEQANVSVLAGAVWQSPGATFALQDLRVLRGRTQAEASKGRGDLYFDAGAFTCDLEAKLRWPKVPSDVSVRIVRDALDDASTQLTDLPPSTRADMGVAICFVVPELAPSRAPEAWDYTRRVLDLVREDVIRGSERCFYAEYRVPEAMAADQVAGRDGRHLYPGVGIIGRVRWPRGRGD